MGSGNLNFQIEYRYRMKAAVSSTVSVERSISFSVQWSLMYHCSSLVKYLAKKLTWLTFGFKFFIYTVHFSGMQKLRRKISNEEK